MIKSLQSMRFYLALTIFLNHIGFISCVPVGLYLYDHYFHNGNYAVTFFFILSGFSIAYGYSDKFKSLTRSQYIDFVKKRIRKIYPLYITTMAAVYILWLFTKCSSTLCIIKYTFGLALCASMMQALTVKYHDLFNSVGWFISCLFFLYLITPFLLQALYRFRKNNKCLLVIFTGQFCSLSILLFFTNGLMTLNNFYLFSYTTPYVRFFYYCSGILLGMLFKNIKPMETTLCLSFFNVMEVGFIIILIFVYSFGMMFEPLNPYITLLYTPVFMATILTFAFDSGIVSKFLSSKINLYLSSIALEFYLVHYICVFYGSKILINLCGNSSLHIFTYCVILFLLSVLLAIIAHKYLKI